MPAVRGQSTYSGNVCFLLAYERDQIIWIQLESCTDAKPNFEAAVFKRTYAFLKPLVLLKFDPALHCDLCLGEAEFFSALFQDAGDSIGHSAPSLSAAHITVERPKKQVNCQLELTAEELKKSCICGMM